MTLEVMCRKALEGFVLDVRFELPTPGVVALFGPSGCGKTSTIKVIAGLLAPDRGRVVLDDSVLLDTERGLEVAAERRRIGYVFQDARLFPHLSVGANLEYARSRAARRSAGFVTRERVLGMLDLGALLGRRVHQLSGGERQRVAIGRALLAQPQLLLLDEPLASLDRERREEVLPYLETLRDELAIPMVYVSHQFDEVLRLATHIVLIKSGTVIAQGGVGPMSLDPELRSMVGRDEVGAIVDATVLGTDLASGLVRVRVGSGEIRVLWAPAPATGTRLRLHLLARDVIVSTREPRHLSVRNQLSGTISAVTDDGSECDLIVIDIGGAALLARITKAATRELSLEPGVAAWALIKAVSLRGHAFPERPAVGA